MKKFLLVLFVSSLTFGCVSKNREIKAKRKVAYDYENFKALTIDEIKNKMAQDPDNPQPYFLLGQVYEESGQLLLAVQTYEAGISRFQNAPNFDPQQKYTGGHFRIGRLYARLSQYARAIFHLEKVVAMEPAQLGLVIQNYHFRESHYLLGASYKETLDLAKSEYHFTHFLKLGGEEWRAVAHLSELKKKR
jgi:tetratricopeptide (TPR) repeat protein